MLTFFKNGFYWYVYSFKSQENNILLQYWSILAETLRGGGERAAEKDAENTTILKIQCNFSFSRQRLQFQWQQVIWEKSDFDIQYCKPLFKLIVLIVWKGCFLFIFYKVEFYVFKHSINRAEWAVRSEYPFSIIPFPIIPFPLTGWRLNYFYPLRIYKERDVCFLKGLSSKSLALIH